MNDRFPPLVDPATLPDRVLCIAPHADDEVLGCGGTLARHVAAGHTVRVVVLCAAPGDPRALESEQAARMLGIPAPRFLALPDGELDRRDDLATRIAAELEEFRPGLVYGPATLDHHPDHAAAGHAVRVALGQAVLPGVPRLLCYSINTLVPPSLLVDITESVGDKRSACECFASQLPSQDLPGKAAAVDRARTVNIDDPAVRAAEGFIEPLDGRIEDLARELLTLAKPLVVEAAGGAARDDDGVPAATAVISTWNKAEDVRANLEGLRRQTRPFHEIVVVDNASSDGTAAMVRRDFPEVRLVVMPNSDYGACETFNVGFACVQTPFLAILDDDVVLPPDWLEKTATRLAREPEETGVLSTKIVEPDMPESYRNSPGINTERYMSTFRGCGSLARTAALREAGWYDERLFIYGNERDLTCRLLNRGYRVLQFPEVETFHRTPFGVKMGKRSLYYHARNAWLSMIKYAPLGDLVRLPWLVVSRVLLRGGRAESEGEVTDATGTIGIGRSIRETPGSLWVLVKAASSVVWNLPYCLKRREPVRHGDFELPLK